MRKSINPRIPESGNGPKERFVTKKFLRKVLLKKIILFPSKLSHQVCRTRTRAGLEVTLQVHACVSRGETPPSPANPRPNVPRSPNVGSCLPATGSHADSSLSPLHPGHQGCPFGRHAQNPPHWAAWSQTDTSFPARFLASAFSSSWCCHPTSQPP